MNLISRAIELKSGDRSWAEVSEILRAEGYKMPRGGRVNRCRIGRLVFARRLGVPERKFNE